MPSEPAPPFERRHEPRLPAGGRVRLLPDVPALTAPLEGSLLDISAHGFRAAHHCPELTSGCTVSFEHARGAGRARVVWTRILGTQVESGFCYPEALRARPEE